MRYMRREASAADYKKRQQCRTAFVGDLNRSDTSGRIYPVNCSKKEVRGASNIFCPGATKHIVTPLRMCTRPNSHAHSTFQYITANAHCTF